MIALAATTTTEKARWVTTSLRSLPREAWGAVRAECRGTSCTWAGDRHALDPTTPGWNVKQHDRAQADGRAHIDQHAAAQLAGDQLELFA